VATSGQPGADLFTIGTPNTWFRLCDAYLVLTAFNIAATVTVRSCLNIAGAERRLEGEWDVATDGEIAYIFWFWEMQLYGPLRIEVYSSVIGDDGFPATYEYRVKSW